MKLYGNSRNLPQHIIDKKWGLYKLNFCYRDGFTLLKPSLYD